MSKDTVIRIILGSSIGVLTLLFLVGWLGYDYGRSLGEMEVADLKRVHAEELGKATIKAFADYSALVERGNTAEHALLLAKQQFAKERQTLQRKIHHVTTSYQTAPDTAPVRIPRTVFTAGFVRHYNAAIGLPGVSTPADSRGTGRAPPAAAATDGGLRESGVTQADILAHIGDYGERCRGLESQVNGLLDWLEPVSDKSGGNES
ncbi:MAG: hypothetical protein LBK01_04485 [Burkholderiaceae bacterium]|jgi:hypothetical protein|nr:hypothetical protein [Burkholderiaceae bacterium]